MQYVIWHKVEQYSGNINDPLQTYIHTTLRRASLRRLVVVYFYL